MFIVERESATSISLRGVIDESSNLSLSIGATVPALDLNCALVTRINSVGVKAWRDYFSRFRKEGGALRFFELSPVLVAAMGYISDFVLPTEVQSVCANYHCSHCSNAITRTIKIEELRNGFSAFEVAKCTACGKVAELDEIAEEYFSFVEKS